MSSGTTSGRRQSAMTFAENSGIGSVAEFRIPGRISSALGVSPLRDGKVGHSGEHRLRCQTSYPKSSFCCFLTLLARLALHRGASTHAGITNHVPRLPVRPLHDVKIPVQKRRSGVDLPPCSCSQRQSSDHLTSSFLFPSGLNGSGGRPCLTFVVCRCTVEPSIAGFARFHDWE